MRNSKSPAASVVLGFIPLSLMTIAACSTTSEAVPPSSPAGAMCTADGLERYTGQAATAELARRIIAESGARAFRWLPRGTMVTMEYRGDRVNVRLDGNGRVESVNCG